MLQGRLRQAMAMGSHSLPILDQVTKVGGTVIGIITATSLQGPCGRLLADILRQEKHISPMSWWYFMIFYVLSRVKPLLWGLPGRKWSRQIHIYIYTYVRYYCEIMYTYLYIHYTPAKPWPFTCFSPAHSIPPAFPPAFPRNSSSSVLLLLAGAVRLQMLPRLWIGTQVPHPRSSFAKFRGASSLRFIWDRAIAHRIHVIMLYMVT
jgi:hypothetical protein